MSGRARPTSVHLSTRLPGRPANDIRWTATEGVVVDEARIPDDLRYTEEHEWVRRVDDAIVIGITWYAQDQLGDVVYVDLPAAGAHVDSGQPFGEVESTKSVSDLFAPVSGTIAERNEALEERPELINSDPYGEGWMVRIDVEDGAQLGSLLDAEAYRALTS